MYQTYPESSLALRVLGRLSNPSGAAAGGGGRAPPAFEPLITSGRGARVA
jgi:hypothetical protein